ncbi:FAD binding domain-containing protein [Corynespora cassiicola Philippines]|uniref:FAD binding domain-containing protein n=1 Tax=Corynespora cassiicola Philippines TaxID=1448308 RepID=A0A2T2NSM9_CORCC|nr:FAD binding domain-containing protein [Corynespora cassiicola Philippines]
MWVLLSIQILITAITALSAPASNVARDLSSLISRSSTVSVELRARWSEYNTPQPAVIVNVTTENDVATVIRYCSKEKIPFLAQNGANGWAKTFDLGSKGVLINMAGLNKVTFSKDKNQATIGGGAIVSETIEAANAAGVLVQTGNCNCVGTLGAILGGGYGNIMGEVGFGVDNVLSLRVAVATGKIITVSKTSYPDLFWAMRGAGPNFGIVISATVKAWPTTREGRTAWLTSLFYSPEKLPQVAQAIQDLPLKPQQNVYLYLANSGPPSYDPAVLVTGFLRNGTEEEGLAAFAPLYKLGPANNVSAVTPYEQWNTGGDGFCTRGQRKPAYSTAINHMQPEKWSEIWELFVAFQKKAVNTAVLVERYNLAKAASAPKDSSAVQEAFRGGIFAQAIVIPWYDDPTMDSEAEAFGQRVRDIWSYSKPATINPTYINFAHGDEEPEAIYGSNLERLRKLKAKWDPAGVFNQWFKIQSA